MKSVKFLIVMLALSLSCGTMQAQFLKKLGKTVENAAKNATERKAAQKTDEAVSKGIDKATNPDTYKDKDGNESKDDKKSSSKKQSGNNDEGESDESAEAQQDAPKGVKGAEMAYAKNDFVPGDEIIFDDDQVSEQVGEFPSQWDLIKGEAEIASINGKKCIIFEAQYNEGHITPLMKDMKNYLPDEFTIELDFWMDKPNSQQSYWVYLYNDVKKKNMVELEIGVYDGNGQLSWQYLTPTDESRSGKGGYTLKRNSWHHLSLSFNKRAFKAYVDGIRIANVPAVGKPSSFSFRGRYWHTDEKTVAVTNVRIAKGAVPLYDRMMTDGKFITYGITFDVGKSAIKPESMGEINRIVKLMTDNPELKFSVEGHTDSTGKADANQKLSDERSAAVVAKLVETGIAKDRLQSAGKGQTSPIADNGTDEGRAKNRRVEFVKI
jgi:outer membrane protein OmpA-like peptidoglycan-associated protein